MEAVGLGIDIVELARVQAAYERHRDRFLERVYTREERRTAAALLNPIGFLAGRFVAKEAVLKVLGTGLSQGISWQDIHIQRDASGAPRVRLCGRALEKAVELKLGRILVSIAHGRDHAVAQALGAKGDPQALRVGPQESY